EPEEQRPHHHGGDARRRQEDEHRQVLRGQREQPQGHRHVSGSWTEPHYIGGWAPWAVEVSPDAEWAARIGRVIADLVHRGLQEWWAPALAFAAGVVSFASPCVLPLVPGYLSFITGGQAGPDDERPRPVVPTLLFI